MALLNLSMENSIASLHSVQHQGKEVESQAWGHTNHCLHNESKIPKGVVELLYEWLMGFVGDLTRSIEKKSLEFYDREEENVSTIIMFGWHNMSMFEHLIQGTKSSTMSLAEIHQKQWDPGKPYLAIYIIGTSFLKLWDPGRTAMANKFKRRLHWVLTVGIKGIIIIYFAAKMETRHSI